MEQAGHLHKVGVAPQRLERRPHAGLVLADVRLGPAAGPAPLQPHGVAVTGDPHARLLQAGLDDVDGHGRVHEQAGAQARLHPAGFGCDDAAQRDAENTDALQIQPPRQD